MIEQIGMVAISLRDNPMLMGIQVIFGICAVVLTLLWFFVASVVGKRG